MKSKFHFILVFLSNYCFSQVVNNSQQGNSYNNFTPEDDDIFYPSDFVSGWTINVSGKKEFYSLKLRVKDQRVIIQKDGKSLILGIQIKEFGLLDENANELHFKRLDNGNSNFYEILNDSSRIKFLSQYSVWEYENTSYSDVNRKKKELHKDYFIFMDGNINKVVLSKSGFLNFFNQNNYLKDYFKKHKVNFKNRNDLALLFEFINSDKIKLDLP